MILAVLVSCCKKKAEYPNAKVPYIVETLSTPPGLHAETGGIAFLPDGRLVACFLRGEVMIYNPETKEWKLFAEGWKRFGKWILERIDIAALRLGIFAKIFLKCFLSLLCTLTDE